MTDELTNGDLKITRSQEKILIQRQSEGLNFKTKTHRGDPQNKKFQLGTKYELLELQKVDTDVFSDVLGSPNILKQRKKKLASLKKSRRFDQS